MRLAISNIAWDPSEDEIIAALLQRYNIDAIDIAPGKYFPVPTQAKDSEITQIKNKWLKEGVEITGMQALLFGTTGLNVFGGSDSQNAMLQHLDAVCHIASGLEAKRLVFGSPKNRDRTGLNDQKTMDIAVPFFQKLGNIAQNHGVIICLEPNPTCYGANFMTTSPETAEIVKQIAHPSIKMQLDTGALCINNENPVEILEQYSTLIGHIHASEPNLLPLGDGTTDHTEVVKALKHYLPHYLVSIEMLATQNESHPISIERALKVAIQNYLHVDKESK